MQAVVEDAGGASSSNGAVAVEMMGTEAEAGGVESVSIPSCVRECDGLELRVGDDIFFERQDDGILEPGVVVDILREGNKCYAMVRYKDKTWAKFAGYNERKDVESVLLMGQLVTKSRTKRPSRPVARFQPPQVETKAKKPARDAAEQERRKQQKRRRKRREMKKRRAVRRRMRELKAKVFSVEGEMTLSRLTENEFAELVALAGSDDHAAMIDVLTAESTSSGEEDQSGDSGYSSSRSSSSFPESDICSTSEDSSESDGNVSDVSTDSCPSEPDYKYWKQVREPTKDEMKDVGYERFRICPKYDSSDSEESDEESLEMGLTTAVVSWTHRERAAMLKAFLHRQGSMERREKLGALSYKEWCLALHMISEDVGGLDHIESCSAIKGVKRCEGMRTMYGAIRAPLIREMIRIAGVTKDDRFIDIGSGLGTVVLQMAATTGCTATGIELEHSRYNLSAMLSEEFIKTMHEMGIESRFVQQLKGRIEMINGDVRLYEQKILNSTTIYFNNHGVWFDETASKEGEISVEHWVAKIFAKTAVGTRLIILKSIPHLKGDWFKEEMYMARSDWLTWARDEKPLYFYTKLKDTWKCEKCGHENDIVREDQFIWEMKCDNNCPSRATTLRTKQVVQE